MTEEPKTFGQRLLLAVKVAQVRLRFVIVLVAAFLVVGQWGVLRNHWDRIVHRLSGSSRAEQTVSEDTEFFCPMDPGVLSDWPAICPVCNMDLVRRKKGETIALPDGVVARMQFSPYRIQLAGIKTTVVAPRKLSRDIVLSGRLRQDESAVVGRAEGENSKAITGRSLILNAAAYESDLPWLAPGRKAVLRVEELGGESISAVVEAAAEGRPENKNHVRLRVTGAEQHLSPGMFALATISIPLTEIEPFRSRQPGELSEGVLAVPETAVVDTGTRQVVYVETMPGMFDGVEVSLGPRCGDFFPLLKGLEAGQRVATAGAFLIDAEARLNPSLAAGYFGANRAGTSASAKSTAPAITPSKSAPATAKTKLSAADKALVDRQKICPVTDLPLHSMGGPIPVDVAGRKVFICCKGCESRLKNDPQKYLAKLKPPN